MHFEVLNNAQKEMLPQLSVFRQRFYLVGGTAIALHIGHRYSIDFDLFTKNPINHNLIADKLLKQDLKYELLFKNAEGFHIISNGVKITFFQYPFQIKHNVKIKEILTMPDLLDLAAMKAYALGRRSKWKDYVDLYFLLKYHYSFETISMRAEMHFGGAFSKKLFKSQLGFFTDIDYSETVDFLAGFYVEDDTIKSFLTDISFDVF